MAVNKVVFGNQVAIDISDSTVNASSLLEGIKAYGADGLAVTGTLKLAYHVTLSRAQYENLTAAQKNADDTWYYIEEDSLVTLTFLDYDGETVYTTVTGHSGDPMPTIQDPVHTGSKFIGWGVTLPETIPSEDTTYTSQWDEAVTLTFLGHDGTPYTTESVFPGDPMPVITDPTDTNARFKNWSPSLPATVPSSDTTYTSQWDEKMTLVFYADRRNPDTTAIESYMWKELSGYPGDPFPNPGTPSPSSIEAWGTFSGWNPSLPSLIPSPDMNAWNPYVLMYDAKYS
jgi:hypothetical protein